MRMGCCAGAIHHSSGLRGSQERSNQLPGPQSGLWLLEGASGAGTRGTLDQLHMWGRQPGRRARPLAPMLPPMLLMTGWMHSFRKRGREAIQALTLT